MITLREVVVGGLAPTPTPRRHRRFSYPTVRPRRVHAGENVLVSGFIVPGTAQFTGCFGRFVRKEPRNNTVTTKFWRGANFSER